jgi:hypothetical protein
MDWASGQQVSRSNMPKKSSGQIGPTKITTGPQGNLAEYLPVSLPDDKEELEKYFADVFVQRFNELLPLGPDIVIAKYVQNDTSDLDFCVECPIADYLELAELNPRSEIFGRHAFRSGRLRVHEYARWIYFSLIAKKQRAYGATAKRTMLLLYCSHWQFFAHELLIQCLTARCKAVGVELSAVFCVSTNGQGLVLLDKVWPPDAAPIRRPKDFKSFEYVNLPPGQSNLEIKFDEID